ncbi:hypothetical protein [Planococcus lenghuensis]|uniref:Uncharacterized protein n=1 Tax=Planococcus lenghuensis TaxID=2213202 RepID=A0A1Q2KVA6_9BACL|nr:hypothetical protein [Planococcus lenghuensis]AQQ52131.1 hypothetical protein B0X71_02655 [Planococcus lenghuensis]
MVKKTLKAEDYLQHLYVYVNESERFALFSGLTFRQFTSAVRMPENLLLLKHGFEDAAFNMHTRLEFVPYEDYGRLQKSVAAVQHELCWIDFVSEKGVQQLSPAEQAELLYIGHKKEAIRPPFYAALQNEFVYLAAEDGQTVKIYFRNLSRISELIGSLFIQLIRKEENGQSFFRRKPKDLIPDMPADILVAISNQLKDGVLLSLANPEKTKNVIELHVRQAEEISFLDEFGAEISEIVQQQPDLKAVFDRRLKQWKE